MVSGLWLIQFHRIFENQHLLDATEIFRKLNVHKKVCLGNKSRFSSSWRLSQHELTLQCRNPSASSVSISSCSSSTSTA